MKKAATKIVPALLALIITYTPLSAFGIYEAPKNSARCAILIHADSGKTLLEQNADERMLIASTTKIMTALVVLENCALDEAVEITDDDVLVEGSRIYIKPGQICTVEQLLYGMMLSSGNDAALALARHCAGSVESFAAKMNARAKALDMTGSSFQNPHGLDGEAHFSTARDMAKLTIAAMKNETFRQIVSTKRYKTEGLVYKNHNKLLFEYDGALGVKTGYTKKAGRILVSCAERDGLCLICVTISDPDDWRDHAALFDWGFSRFEWRSVAEKGEFARLPVISGEAGFVGIVPQKALEALIDKAGETDTYVRVNLPRFVFAPVKAGRRAGCIELLSGGSVIERVELYYSDSVKGIKNR